MKRIANVYRALAGHFFDDGWSVLAIVVLLACTGLVAKRSSSWVAMALLVGGTLALLCERVVRAALRSGPSPGDCQCNSSSDARHHFDTSASSNGNMHSTAPNRLRPPPARKPIGLALQGGGSWGAYTWGVLDSLLASRSLAITQLSGTSAGAINAALVAGALAKGSPARARKALRSFWLSIADPAASDVVRSLWGPLERQWRNSMNDWLLTSGLMSLYGAKSLGIGALRDVIAAHVDIDAIRSEEAPALFVTLTNVRTGLPRIITNAAMSVDALLASACQPDLFPAVEIDGEYYWDGGYGGNPSLWPMIHSQLSSDIVLVQLAPDCVDDVPTDALSIRRRVGEIVFHSSLVAEMQTIHAMRVLARNDGPGLIFDLRFHRVGPPRPELFERGNGVERARAWLQLLHAEGLAAGRHFTTRHAVDVGRRETLDVARIFVDPGKSPKSSSVIEVPRDSQNAPMSRAA